MEKKSPNKVLFGLKVKELRGARGLSFAEFSQQTGISVSYLNEIEKGKKYPSPDKIELIANTLSTTAEELISTHLSSNLAPVEALLNSNFLNELPLDLFGIELNKVAEIIAKAPIKVGAFISTLLDLARTYNVREENFYNRALRAYQELHYNYFEDIEQAVDLFVNQQNLHSELLDIERFQKILTQKFHYQIDTKGLDAFPELCHLRSLTIISQKKMLLSSALSAKQVKYQLTKELGYCVLDLQERIDLRKKATTFEQVLSNYKAAYFAVSLLIPQQAMTADIQTLFAKKNWDGTFLGSLLDKYQVTAETLFQRFNVLPRTFGIHRLFFMRIIHDTQLGTYEIDKELHLSQKHQPHSNGLSEQYCRRWVAIDTLQNIDNELVSVSIQRSKFVDTSDEYLSISMSRMALPNRNQRVSVTISLLIDKQVEKQIKFLDDTNIPTKTVGVTCERCSILDCAQRAAPPIKWEARQQKIAIREALDKALGSEQF